MGIEIRPAASDEMDQFGLMGAYSYADHLVMGQIILLLPLIA